ncbi:MAG: hypothetical protein BMS9Abin17_1705 [Acidimicrobiia bacterium]|nr:MAG: hypothetical protein BMS9Abin17_1705 [Acidimicrobiia bacterium]
MLQRSIGVRFLLISIALVVSSCSLAEANGRETADAPEQNPIEISMSLYVVDDASDPPSSPLSSSRTTDEIASIAERIRSIWLEAGVDLTIRTISRITAPPDVLERVARGETSSFVDAAVSGAISVPEPAIINGFYVRQVGSANGETPLGTRIFFVTDNPSVHDERVSSHEIGHILGLHHTQEDSGRLMYSGTNGMSFSDGEIDVARYGAAGILDGNR